MAETNDVAKLMHDHRSGVRLLGGCRQDVPDIRCVNDHGPRPQELSILLGAGGDPRPAHTRRVATKIGRLRLRAPANDHRRILPTVFAH